MDEGIILNTINPKREDMSDPIDGPMKQLRNNICGLYSKVSIAPYVLRRLLYHKTRYRYMLDSHFPGFAKSGYLYRRSARNKVICSLVGMEGLHLILFGRRSSHSDLVFKMACLIVAYDNAIDEEQFRDWDGLESFLRNPSDEQIAKEESAIGTAQRIVLSLKEDNNSFWEEARELILSIHLATKENFIQATSGHVDIEKLRKSSYNKGGYAFVLLAQVHSRALAREYFRIIYDFGAAVQIADDIYDRREDSGIGQDTLASRNLLQECDMKLVREAWQELPRSSGHLSRVLFNAWRTHVLDSLEYYQSGRLAGRWKYGFGESLLAVGVYVVPTLPTSFFWKALCRLGFR